MNDESEFSSKRVFWIKEHFLESSSHKIPNYFIATSTYIHYL